MAIDILEGELNCDNVSSTTYRVQWWMSQRQAQTIRKAWILVPSVTVQCQWFVFLEHAISAKLLISHISRVHDNEWRIYVEVICVDLVTSREGFVGRARELVGGWQGLCRRIEVETSTG